ncbi:lipopolysaccharide transport periplasmic protein LptA [Gilliamella sp. App6-5]|jgi:lipopolysaccharide export system protein LptA|uniref:lipopolysaccharide transport periplasmic protein LptA n=1 Tax=Gilliamella sp. App6-5 TaxID=3120232 RepID=UPI00080DC4C8|nr:lipopolysaccharide transport periplasmic protein LptA [Gilliamella apicola]OCG13343.1 lipopolysaccharide transport periplasmic protein LptA [Gilliamella apicola]
MSSLKQVVCSLLLLLPISLSSFANGPTTPADPKMFVDNKPIAIDADNQQIDIENNTITFIGNVVIVQEGLTINADKVVVTEMQNTEKQKITAYGKPVNYKQILPKNNKIVTGHSSQVIYNVKQNNIVLQGNAELFQQDNHIVSEMIIYDVKKQQIFAQPGKNRRVKSTIIPNQVKEMSK